MDFRRVRHFLISGDGLSIVLSRGFALHGLLRWGFRKAGYAFVHWDEQGLGMILLCLVRLARFAR